MEQKKPFAEFEGIGKEKAKKHQKLTVLDMLLDEGQAIVSKYHPQVMGRFSFSEFVSSLIYDDLKKDLQKMRYDSKDINDLVLAKQFSGHDIVEKKIYGVYTACLAELLTERNKMAGKRTRIQLNGSGKRFDYLFYSLRFVDELIVEDFSGDFICSGCGRNEGAIDLLVIRNIKGHFTGSEAAYDSGKIKAMAIIGCEGDDSFAFAGDCGKIDTIIAAGNKGKSLGYGVGMGAGHIGLCLRVRNDTSYPSTTIGSNPQNIDTLILNDANLISEYFFGELGDLEVKNQFFCSEDELQSVMKGAIDIKNPREDQVRKVKEFRVEEFFDLAEGIESLETEQLKRTIYSIQKLYKSIPRDKPKNG